MRLMMDVTEYVELPGVPPTLHAFAEAAYLAKGVFTDEPVEFVVPTMMLRDLLRVVMDEEQQGRAAATIGPSGLVAIVGIPVVQTDKDVPVRLVFTRETLAVRGE